MKPISLLTIRNSKVFGLALCLGALPLVTTLTGCVGDRYHQSTGESIDDHAISMRVKNALSNDPEYKFHDVDVKTFKGTVQLSGFVNTRAQKDRAGDVAKGVDGAKDVENNITVKD